LACQLLNRMRELGRPQSYAVSWKRDSRDHLTCCSIRATTPLGDGAARGGDQARPCVQGGAGTQCRAGVAGGAGGWTETAAKACRLTEMWGFA